MIKQLAAIATVSSCLAITTVRAAEVNFCAASVTKETCPLSESVVVVVGRQGDVMKLDQPFANVRIGAADGVVDVEVLTDHRFILRGISAGRTDVVFYDKNNDPVKNLDVIVQPDPGRVRVFNKKLFGSQVWECTPLGCEYVSETHYENPAQNLNVHQTGNGAPAPVVVAPQQ